MYKVFAVLFFILAAPVAKGEYEPEFPNNYQDNSTMHIDAYINLNRQQHEADISEFDKKIEIFKQSYSASLEIIHIKLDLLIFALAQSDERFNPLVVISEQSRNCVNKYRNLVPTIVETKSKILDCVNEASNKLPSLMVNVINTRNYLENYYKNTFEAHIVNCERTYGKYVQNYTLCVTNVVTETNTYTITHQKLFDQQMTALECSSNAIIKQTLECSFDIESSTISGIAEATTLINRCLAGAENCKPCPAYSCPVVSYVDSSEMDYNTKIIKNPFYGRDDIKNCLLLKTT